ncbi:hypothetical protein HanPI659440_Chr04g0177051 [Helianthus annuus]|nr:hypothetical protein HanPI659440_Chr04g0177051 [Helianthus annuus]
MPPVPGKTRPCTRPRARQCKAGKTRVDQESNSRPFGQESSFISITTEPMRRLYYVHFLKQILLVFVLELCLALSSNSKVMP